MTVHPEEFTCPRCAASLLFSSGDQLQCKECRRVYPVRDGILDFRLSRQDYYFNPVPRPVMEELIREMTRENWEKSIRTFVKNVRNPQHWLDNLIVDGRYAWKILLNLKSETVLLDLGCGLGNLTKNLAPHVAKVYAMDLTYPRLEFAKKRFSIFNREDEITLLAAGDSGRLPFPDDSIDCVVLSGVLEWVGVGDDSPYRNGPKLSRLYRMLSFHFGDRNPRRIQLRFLKEIRRVLRESGQLFIGIENRLNYEYFVGRPDHHSRLHYASLLPRLLANLYSIAKRRKPYRTYTYSIPGYKRLLDQAGFPETEFFGLSQGYSQLEEVHPAEAEISNWRPERPRSLKKRLKRSKYFVPAYGILASSVRKPWPRLQDRLLAEIEEKLRADATGSSLVLKDYVISGKDKLVLKAFLGDNRIVIRIPLNETALTSEERNAMLLDSLRTSASRLDFCPVPLVRGNLQGLSYFVENQMSGRPLAAKIRAEGRASMIGATSALLDGLNPEPSLAQLRRLSGDLYTRLVMLPLEDLFCIIPDPVIRQGIRAFFDQRLHGIEVTVGITHGDFSVRNILVTGDRVSGLIDWEGGSLEGLPILDAINYLGSVHLLFNPGDRLAQSVPLLASGKWPVGEEWNFLLARYARYQIDPADHEGLVYLAWLHHVTILLRSRLMFDPVAIDSHVLRVATAMMSAKSRRNSG